MKAVFFEKHGGPEVLQCGDFRNPEVGPHDVLVAVRACALNHLDLWVRQGLPGISIPIPHIPGSDVAGTVLETGESVQSVRKGQKVLVSPGQLSADHPEAKAARDSFSPEFQILGLQTQGGYAERVCVRDSFVIPVSDRYSFEEWACLPLVSLTAYHMLVQRIGLRAGETVLIHAAGSGVGSMAIQLAKSIGARVFTTVGDSAKEARARTLGADEVIRYKEKDFSEEVKRLTNGRGVDVLVDHIGPDTWQKNLSSLCRGGRFVFCGATSGPKVEMDLRLIFSKQISLHGAYMGSLSELREVLKLAEKGVLKPVLDEVFPLEKAAEAHRRMEGRRNFGKIVLKI